ncbi:MAG TPA: biotin/lipoyl-binding protein, partial [Terriglobia bacterium]|nr:biotin/lipoyl-binding protein [Terriglobia bacterium]
MSIMRSRWLLVVLILVVAAGAAFYHFRNPPSDDGVLRASGTIEATKVDVSFQISGRVAVVTAVEGQPVKTGDVLGRLDPKELQAHVNQIKASLDVAQKQILQQKSTVDMRQDIVEGTINQSKSQTEAARVSLDRVRNGSRPEEIRVAEEAVKQAEADLDRRKSDFQRMSDLKTKDIVSQQEFDASQSAYRMAETAVV